MLEAIFILKKNAFPRFCRPVPYQDIALAPLLAVCDTDFLVAYGMTDFNV